MYGCAVSANSGHRRLPVRLAALIVCSLFALALVLSAAFILAHANHEHDHDGGDGDCAACAQITAFVDTLSRAGAAMLVVAAVTGGLFGTAALLKSAAPRFADFTLISLKIRLNI